MEWLQFLAWLAEQDQANQQTQALDALAKQVEQNQAQIKYLYEACEKSDKNNILFFGFLLGFSIAIVILVSAWNFWKIEKRIKQLEKKSENS